MHRVSPLLFSVLVCAACGSGNPSVFDNGTDGAADAVVDDANGDPDAPGLNPSDASPMDVSSDGKPSAPNLVLNGDFEKGNMFFGSDYSYAVKNTVEGEYTVGTNGQAFNGSLESAGDHTSGKGQMFIGNGKATPDRVWFPSATITVSPNTTYYFEAWVMNLCCASGLGDGINPVGPSVLSFYANGQLLGTRTSMKLGKWEGLSTNWNSGAATTVTLKLVNANTDALGNDFAVDDIYLGTETSIIGPN